MEKDTLFYLNLIAQSIYDKKGFNIFALDVRGLSSISDYLIIAEGSVGRHVTALAKQIEKDMLEQGQKPLFEEGVKDGDWAVIDFGEVIVHLFTPELRHKYQLEQLWKKGKIVELSINCTP